MILVKIKKILLLIILILPLYSCTSNKYSNNDINASDKYNEIIKNMESINNYNIITTTNIKYTYKKSSGTEVFSQQQIDNYKTDGINYILTEDKTSSLQDKSKTTTYYYNGSYYLNEDDVKVKLRQDIEDKTLLNLKNLQNKEGIEKIDITKQDKYYILDIKYNKEKQKEIFESYSILNDSELKIEKPYKYLIKVDDKVKEENISLTYSYTNEELKLTVEIDINTQFIDYGNVKIENLDFSDYKEIDTTITQKSIKQLLKDVLKYQPDTNQQNKYKLEYNDNETYIFDFDSKIFYYHINKTAFAYNWSSDVGTTNKCIYNFQNEEEKGSCSKEEIEKIKDTKDNLKIELAQIDKDLDSLKEEK